MLQLNLEPCFKRVLQKLSPFLDKHLMAEEELSVLGEIFCFPGELVHWRCKDVIHVNVNISESCAQMGSHNVLLSFILSSDYPSNGIPEINVSAPSLPADIINQTKDRMQVRAITFTGEPMLMELIELAKESITFLHDPIEVCLPLKKTNMDQKKLLKDEEVQPETDPNTSREQTETNCSRAQQKELWITLIQLDHMRSKSKYTKIIKNWSKIYNLFGRLIFCQKLILILLIGVRENLKNYLVQHKTACVDVDSRGHSCKERMMTVLTEEPYTESNQEKNIGFSDFQIVECSSTAELENIFKSANLLLLYKTHVMR